MHLKHQWVKTKVLGIIKWSKQNNHLFFYTKKQFEIKSTSTVILEMLGKLARMVRFEKPIVCPFLSYKASCSNHTFSFPFLFSYVVRTDPHDVARVESKTFICTEEKRESIPQAKEGVKGQLGNWMSVSDMNRTLGERYPGCMKG